MRFIKLFSIGLLIAASGFLLIHNHTSISGLGQNTRNEYRVSNVIDGDTIEIIRYGKIEKVRLIGIDTPETVDPRKAVQCFGLEASGYAKQALSNKTIRLEFDPMVGERDKYGRLLGYVWLDSDTLVNNELVKQGYAHEYTYRSQAYKYQRLFKSSEQEAKQGAVGFWSPQTCNGKTK